LEFFQEASAIARLDPALIAVHASRHGLEGDGQGARKREIIAAQRLD